MQIGAVTLKNPVIMAPLAGITDLPFRLLVKAAGAALVYSEMISANGLVHGSAKTMGMLTSRAAEKPLSVQIFGSNPGIMAKAAKMVQASGADILDINFGCSVKKVVKTGSGAALMRTPDLAESILKAVRDAIDIPLTLKMRTGWDKSGNQALQLAEMAEECGVNAICLHPRTAGQGFSGQADWTLIKKVARQASIRVMGNGDIITPEDAAKMLNTTKCQGIMIGRAAVGNPWIFSQVLAHFRGEKIPLVSTHTRKQTMLAFLDAAVQYYGEKQACRMMRSRLGWFVKGLKNCSQFRESIKRLSTQKEAEARIQAYFTQINGEKRQI